MLDEVRTCRCAWAFYVVASEAVALMTGMSGIFKLRGGRRLRGVEGRALSDAGATLAACMRSAPIADINYIDAFAIGASDVRDHVPLLH